ncbi:MAG: ABC transporter permease [Actinomycetota bacterium]|nr:ABC transporter permease [Actinomycetota bacterium]
MDWAWVGENLGQIRGYALQHLFLTAVPVAAGFALAFPMSLAAIRWRRLYGPLLGLTGMLFTIPSIALFVLLIPVTGLGPLTAIVPLTIYTLLILIRNTVEGLDGVDPDVREAAEAMGYTRGRQLFGVELPLALPVIVAGLRIATVTTVGLVTITALIGAGGLGRLIVDGFTLFFPTSVVVGVVLSVAFAVAADLVLLAGQKALTPWRAGRA